MNYFAYRAAAERYANGRPFFHPLAVRKIRTNCCESGRIDRALDVGCGTGQSTMALLEIADEIVGLDNSTEMLSHAAPHERIRYVEGRAEELPFPAKSFGLVTVALAFHWFDQRKFLTEAHRVLRPGGWLVIYNDAFTGRMNANINFETWHRERYLMRYPSPPRNNQLLAEFDASASGLAPSNSELFVHEVEFTLNQLVTYLLTQTNVITAVEAGSGDLQAVAEWLLQSVRQLFRGSTEMFPFLCQVRFLKRI